MLKTIVLDTAKFYDSDTDWEFDAAGTISLYLRHFRKKEDLRIHSDGQKHSFCKIHDKMQTEKKTVLFLGSYLFL